MQGDEPEAIDGDVEVVIDPADEPIAEHTVLPFDEWVERVQKSFQMAQRGVDIPEPTAAWREAYDAGTTPADYFATLTN